MTGHVRVAVLSVLLPAVTASVTAKQTVVFAGGCFWGVEAVFEHLRGVQSATSGYATPVDDPKGFAEAVRVEYDPARITYEQLLQVFFLVAHDPTQVDRQGPDVGPRYRSIVFVRDTAERRIVQVELDSLRARGTYSAPIVTAVAALRSFSIAEDFHQDFVVRHPQDAYVVVNDLPKIAELRRRFPALYQQ
jgi:peptide-methionine (S)-S-oxide reductase